MSSGPIRAKQKISPGGEVSGPATAVNHRERRSDVRHNFVAIAEITEPKSGNHVQAKLVNLARAGCYLEIKTPFIAGTDIEISITKRAELFRAQARIVYSMPGKGMGVQFTTVEPGQARILHAWLEKSEQLAGTDNRRRGRRLTLAFPVQVSGNANNGKAFVEATNTMTISPYGASFLLCAAMDKGQRLSISNLSTNAVLECLVISVLQNGGDRREVGVSFLMPDPSFWRVAFPPLDWSPRHPDAKRA
jgi:hypothetical protein